MAQEKNFENRVKRFLNEQGCWYVKYWGGGSFTKAGIPDLLVCCNGMFMGVELKADHGKPSALQLFQLEQIDNAGGYGILLYPMDLPDFKLLVLTLQGHLPDYAAAYEIYQRLKKRWCPS